MYGYFAPKTNATFTGTPTATTQAKGDSSTNVATTAFVTTAINDILPPSSLSVQSTAVDNVSIAASQAGSGSFSVAKSGYTPICLVGYNVANGSTSGTNSSRCFLYKAYLNGSTFQYGTRPSNDQAAKIKITAYVLYTKN